MIPLESKAWGKVRHVFDSPQCAVSILHVNAGAYCSRHWHKERVNRFVVVSGVLEVVWFSGDGLQELRRDRLREGDVLDVPAGFVHRFEVIESGIVVELYWPSATCRRDDIVRLDVGGAALHEEAA